jgi:hypothetical protein
VEESSLAVPGGPSVIVDLEENLFTRTPRAEQLYLSSSETHLSHRGRGLEGYYQLIIESPLERHGHRADLRMACAALSTAVLTCLFGR